MRKEIDQIEGILKVLDRACFDHMKVNDIIDTTNKITEFAKGLKSLKEMYENPVKLSDEKKAKIEEKKG